VHVLILLLYVHTDFTILHFDKTFDKKFLLKAILSTYINKLIFGILIKMINKQLLEYA